MQDLLETFEEDYLVRAENQALALARQYEHEFDEDVTDDEVWFLPTTSNSAVLIL